MNVRHYFTKTTKSKSGFDFQNDYYRMLVILPAKDNDIRYVERRIGLLDVKGIDERLDIASTNSEVDVLLPRFETNYDWMDLANSLKSLGVESIFDAEKSNLTNISDDPLYVSTIVHKAIIKVCIKSQLNKPSKMIVLLL